MFGQHLGTGAGKKSGGFTVEQYLKKQKHVIHGFEARTLKHIPKPMFRVCERLLKLCGGGPSYKTDDGANFTNDFVAFKYDAKGAGSKLALSSNSASSNDSILATRRSSRSMLLSTDDEFSTGGLNTPQVRPNSETGGSLVQSCSSALSGVDDKRLDEILGDGIRNQTLSANRVTQELVSHHDLKEAALAEKLPKYSAEQIYEAFLESHYDKLMRDGTGDFASDESLLFKQYKLDLNYKQSSWDKIDMETDLFVLTALLLEWMEHLKSPILDRDGITYVVIHCDNIEAALKR